MAGEVDDIVQNVVLTGNEEVSSAFEKIQESGTRAFEAIESAMERSIFSFSGLATAAGGVTAAVAGIGVGMFAFTQSTAAAISELSDLSSATGIAIEDIGGLKEAFAAGGVGAEQMQSAFRRLSIITQSTWAEIKKASRDGADNLKQDALAISNAEIAQAQAQQKAATISKDQALQARADSNSIADARQKLDELFVQRLKASGVDTTALEQQLASQKQLNEEKAAELALANAKKKAADDAKNAPLEALKAQNDQIKSTLDLAAAQRKAVDDQKNDIDSVIDAVKQLGAGNKDALKDINASTENLIKGIVGAAGDAAHSLDGLKGDITDLASPAPGVRQVFETLGQTLKNLDDPAQKTALAFRLLGRSVGQEFINVISDPAKIDAFIARVKELGLNVEEVDVQISEKFRSALFTLQTDIELVGNKIASAFGPGFTQILNALDAALISSKDKITTFAESIAGQAVPVVESFIRVLSGAPDAAKDQWLLDYISKIKAFGSALGELISIVTTVATTISSAFNGVAKDINSVFGTSLNGVDLIFGLWVTKILGGFTAISEGAALAGRATAAGFAVAAPELALIAAGIFAIVEAFKAIKDLSVGDGKLESSLTGLSDRLHAIREFLAGDFAKGIEDFKKANADQIAAEKKIDEDHKKAVDDKTKADADAFKAEQDYIKTLADTQKQADIDTKNSSKAVADQRLADSKRVTNAQRDLTESTKRDNADIAQLQQTSGINFGQKTPIKSATPPSPGSSRSRAGDAASNADLATIASELDNALAKVPDATATQVATIMDAVMASHGLRPTGGSVADSLGQTVRSGGSDILNPFFKNNVPNPQPEPVQTKEQFDQQMVEELKALKQDFDSQKAFNENIARQNGGIQNLPPGGVSPSYPPPVPGHYDPVTQQFIPNNPNASGFGFQPKTNDFSFAGQQNPFPYQPGISTPLTFPNYLDQLRNSLPSNIPLPTARPDSAPQMQKDWVDAVKEGVVEGQKEVVRDDIGGAGGRDTSRSAQDLPGNEPVQSFFHDLVHDFLDKAVNDPGAIQGKTRPDSPDKPSVDTNTLPDVGAAPLTSAIENLTSKFDGWISQLGTILSKPQDQTITSPDQLGIRGDAIDTIDTSFQTASTSADDAGTALTTLQGAADGAASALTRVNNDAGTGGGSSVNAATGGHIRGPGGPTSDSIAAWLSDGEFVQSARAVSFWGTDFMHAINQMRIPRFALGGLVSPSLPRFKDGGFVQSPSIAPHLGTVDLRTNFGDVRVSVERNTLSKLRQAAVMRNLGANAKSGWVR